jgi:hypothetical protein
MFDWHLFSQAIIQLATEITYEQSMIQLKMVIVTGPLKTASELRKGKEEVVKMRQDELATGKMHPMILKDAMVTAE